ncbi:MAG TPA: hypothetical protein DIV86_04470 [Alphaproteobacteria bacterium]|nr:hypothetical protein [Alphaproteobacteria bacterium]
MKLRLTTFLLLTASLCYAPCVLANSSNVPKSIQYKKLGVSGHNIPDASKSVYSISSKKIKGRGVRVSSAAPSKELEDFENEIIFAANEKSEKGLFASSRPYNIRKSNYVGKLREVGYQKSDDAGLAFASNLGREKFEDLDIALEYYADAGNDSDDIDISEQSYGIGPVAEYNFNSKTNFKVGYQAEMQSGSPDQAVRWQIGRKF